MFPISFKGEFKFPQLQPQDINLVLNGVVQELTRVQATSICRAGHKVSFRGGIFRLVFNWNVLGPVDYGEIEVLPGNPVIVRYNLSCVQMLVLSTLVVVVFLALPWMGGVRTVQETLIVPVFFWLWLFGMNYLVAAVRLPRFVRKAVTKNLPHSWN
jgi:hypothetical protein